MSRVIPLPATEPADLDVLHAAQALHNRQLSATELTEACLARIEERNGGMPTHDGAPDAINAWARVYPALAREHAHTADERLERDREETSPLCGVPIALKDIYGVAGLPLTASSRVLEGNVASEDATAWARLRGHGMVLLGHTHTHEFAAGGTTDQVGNPWALDRVAGGSSGGNAAALAARMVPAALGSDTCGSLRIPSACCGTSAIKPTWGLIPLDGVIPLAWSLDHAGPMARTIADCAALLGGITGIAYPTAARPGPHPLEGVRIAVTDRTEAVAIDTDVAEAFDQASGVCQALGAQIVPLPAAWTLDWQDLGAVLLTEMWDYHRQHEDRHDSYRPAIAELVEAARGFTVPQACAAARERRRAGATIWDRWFTANSVDLILEPTLPIVPYRRGAGYDRGHAGGPGDPMIALTALWNLTGMPVASVPVSWCAGVSLVAPRHHEARLIQAAINLQEHALPPPVWAPADAVRQPRRAG